MADENPKQQAAEAFLDASPSGATPYDVRLAALIPRDLERPDELTLEKMRMQILERAKTRRTPAILYWLPAAAVLLLGFTAVTVFRLQNADTPQIQKIAARHYQSESEVIADSVRIYYRDGQNVVTSLTDRRVTIKADSLDALFDFEPNDRVRAVSIEVPGARYKIVGTRFILKASATAHSLKVQSGKVAYEAGEKQRLVSKGETLTVKTGNPQFQITREDDAALFSTYTDPRTKLQNKARHTTERAETVAKKPVTVHLKNGTVVKGNRLAEDGGSVQLEVAGQTVTLQKEDIAVMQ